MKQNSLNRNKEFVLVLRMLTLLLVSTVVWAESEGFTVSGEISFEKTGNLHVELVTKETFEQDDHDHDHNDREGEEAAPQESPFPWNPNKAACCSSFWWTNTCTFYPP